MSNYGGGKLYEAIAAKAVVVIIGLIIITFGVNWLMHRMHEYEEMHKPPPPKPIVEGFGWGPGEWLWSIFHQVQTIIAQVTASVGIVTTLSIYSIILVSLSKLAEGIFNHFLCGGKFFGYGFANGIQAMGIIFKCFFEKLGSIVTGDCLRFYVVDTIFGLIYFIGTAVLSIVYSITGVDLKPFITMIWNITVLPLDSIIYALTGHNITKWSKSTYDRCYKCSAEFNINGDPATRDMYRLNLTDWYRVLECSIDEMKEGIYKMVTAVIPSRKWGSWSKGDHLPGNDDQPGFTF